MKKSLVLVGAVVVVLGTMVGGAQVRAASVPLEPALDVQHILARNAQARGGQEAWARVQSLRMSGLLDAGRTRVDGGRTGMATSKVGVAQAKAIARKAVATTGRPDPGSVVRLPFQLDLQRPNKSRLEIPFQGDTAIQVFDGQKGWKLRPYLGRHDAEPFSSDELRTAANQQPLDGALINAPAKGSKVELVGTEPVDGHTAYKLRVTLQSAEVRHVWVDAKTFLDLKIDSPPRWWDGKLRAVYTYFHDYKLVQGLMVAHRLETRVEGVNGAENIYVDKVALNPVLPQQHFGLLQ